MTIGHLRLSAFVGGFILCVAAASAQEPPPEGVFAIRQSRLAPGTGEGRAVLAPATFNAGETDTFSLRLTVGSSGIKPGGGLLVAYPKAWFGLQKQFQTRNGDAPLFLSASSSREGAKLGLSLDSIGLDGERNAYAQTIAAKLEGAPLAEGDKITLSLARATAPALAGTDEIVIAVDATGDGQFKRIKAGADYEVLSRGGVEIVMTGPMQAVVGQPIEIHLTAFDASRNAAEVFAGILAVTGLGKPFPVEFGSTDRGRISFKWTPEKEGFFWPVAKGTILIAEVGDFRPQAFSASCNPIQVTAAEPKLKTYWGDLGSRSSISPDGIGKDAFRYAREDTRLDFIAPCEGSADGFTAESWNTLKHKIHESNESGRFVALLGYASPMAAPSGPYDVLFRSLDGLPWPASKSGGIEQLWEKLKEGNALTIPVRLGWAAGSDPAEGIEWRARQNPKLRCLTSVYGAEGSAEAFAPDDELAYEKVAPGAARSLEGEHYLQNGWTRGHTLGVVACSGNAVAQPGQRHEGLTAVLAPELTREAIFDALASRRCYATTGERIYLDFQVTSTPMGQRGPEVIGGKGSFTIAAPGEIKFVELLGSEYDGYFGVLKRWDNPGKLIEQEFETDIPVLGQMLYLRAELKDPVRGRPARVWSSPVWIDP